jgi:alcohol dehydrogenase
VSAGWWMRQARVLGDPACVAAGRVMLERDAASRARRLRAASADRVRERIRPARPKMRALVLKPGGHLTWASVAAPPPPGPLGAVVRPIAVATCDMDRPIVLGATPFVAPLAFGHECVAEVLTVGGDVEHVAPGDRVVVPFQINCGRCPPCVAGLTGSCLSVPPASMYGFGISGGHWGGAVADELAVPFADAMLVPLPHSVDTAAAASVADNVSDAYRHIGPHLPDLLARDPSAPVVVLGATTTRHPFTASVSLYAGLIAQALGALDVTLIDARPDVRRQAEALGLTTLTPGLARSLKPAGLVADVSATPAGLRLALKLTAPDGLCSSSGMLHATARIPTLLMYARNVTLKVARAHARTLIPEVLALMRDDRLHPERVTTVVTDIDDAPRALTNHVRSAQTKTIVAA